MSTSEQTARKKSGKKNKKKSKRNKSEKKKSEKSTSNASNDAKKLSNSGEISGVESHSPESFPQEEAHHEYFESMGQKSPVQESGDESDKSAPISIPFLRSSQSIYDLKSAAEMAAQEEDPVVEHFITLAETNPQMSIAVAAIQALTMVVKTSEASTMMGLQLELRAAGDKLQQCNRTSISLSAGCELFNKYVTRVSVDVPDFEACKARILERGEKFAEMSLKSRDEISKHVNKFISSDMLILTHGFSRVVVNALLHAAKQGKNFNVIVTEGRPNNQGTRTAQQLLSAGIPTTLVLDSAVGFVMERVDLVLVGAEGVVENGGVINMTGTFLTAMAAKTFNRPLYVAAEGYKFARLYPLNQTDLPESKEDQCRLDPVAPLKQFPKGLKIDNPSCDYTPPSFITLIFTDLGILTPSAVSDELIKLYH